MHTSIESVLLIALLGTFGPQADGQLQQKGALSFPDSVMLIGEASGVGLVTTTGVRLLTIPLLEGPLSHPAVSPDGSCVADGVNLSRERISGRFGLGVFCSEGQEWKTYGDFKGIGVPAFSPDSTKIAFAVDSGDRSFGLAILDIASGKITPIPQLTGVAERSDLGWAPDGKRLVAARGSDIAVFDLRTGQLNVIGKGIDPVWSPTGEWIAYSDESHRECIVTHPDGTGTKVLRDERRDFWVYRLIFYGAVWSPDGSRLLLDEIKGEGPNMDVMLVDVTSGKVNRKSRNGRPVFGWAKQKS